VRSRLPCGTFSAPFYLPSHHIINLLRRSQQITVRGPISRKHVCRFLRQPSTRRFSQSSLQSPFLVMSTRHICLVSSLSLVRPHRSCLHPSLLHFLIPAIRVGLDISCFSMPFFASSVRVLSLSPKHLQLCPLAKSMPYSNYTV
jgi:hypothetical protein